MPKSIDQAISFLETQWSSINENKIKGIVSEVRFQKLLYDRGLHYIPGGWILEPGKNTEAEIPALRKICLIPKEWRFSWQASDQSNRNANPTPAEISAYNYFRDVGVTTYILLPKDIREDAFELPVPKKLSPTDRAIYPRSYKLDFNTINPRGHLESVPFAKVMEFFPKRTGNMGLRIYANEIDRDRFPWTDADVVASLFWFEYARYYCSITNLVSNNDLDLFLVGNSGAVYPIELKSKTPAEDRSLGEWFGLDVGPFLKMTFFTTKSINKDALYIVEEVDEDREHVEWYAIRFTHLVKCCSWVQQGGGTNMRGGSSYTVRIPKAAFTKFDDLIVSL